MFSVKVNTGKNKPGSSSSRPHSPGATTKPQAGGPSSSHPASPAASQPTTPRSGIEEVDQLSFSAGNPRVEHITGVVHLYRHIPGANDGGEKTETAGDNELPEGRNEQLCVLGLPPDMGFAEFCTFLGAFFQNVKEIRLVRREGGANVCLVLLTFVSLEAADEFYKDFNGTPFCILEPELLCRLVFVKEVEFSENTASTVPHQAPPPSGTTELPSCPVCLERLDEHVSGIVTTVCNHRFHNDCLRRWGDTSCPVCRYCQHPTEATSHCTVCGSGLDLWICLICGHVGCGRYKGSHAASHWQETGHGYSLELETQRVWDYASDAYVHRLVRSKTDGKLVEVSAGAGSSGRNNSNNQPRAGMTASDECGADCSGLEPEMEEALVLSKLDALATEYNHLLVMQLESQRQYFEGLLVRQRQEMDALSEATSVQMAELKASVDTALANTAEAERRRHQLESKVTDLAGRLKKAQEERDFLKQLNDTLLSNQKDFKEKLASADKAIAVKAEEVNELSDQVRDLMVFIEARQTIEAQGGEELAGGSVMAVPEAAGPLKGNKKGGSKARRK